MNIMKTQLMTAAAVAGLVAASQAVAVPVVYSAASVRGNGASTVAVVIPKMLNCFGGTNNDLGIYTATPSPTGSSQNVPDHNYAPAAPTASNPNWNCNTQSIQPAVEGEYVSTGSGGGVNNFINYNATAAGGANNPFVSGLLDTETWNNIHYAFSENPLTAANITTFYAVEDGADNVLGNGDDVGLVAPIQLPAMITPIALAYSPEYGRFKNGSGVVKSLTLNIKFPRADATGGLRLKRTTYCGILNGTITNWNDAALQSDNGGQTLKDADDDATRWSTTGVPIVLVGRSDSSGGTTLFTRHMAAVCGNPEWGSAGTSTLPAARRDGAAVYDSITGNLASGTVTAGEFGVSSGSSGVANTVDIDLVDPVSNNSYVFNGRFGYIGSDWVEPAVTVAGIDLHSADLQQNGTGTSYKAPNAVNVAAAMNAINPPESLSSGAYSATPGCNKTTANCRANPLSWVQTASASESLAAPTVGYPILGTANILIYTCYVDPAVRTSVNAISALMYGKLPAITSTGAKFPVKLVTNVANDAGGLDTGIFPRNGVSALPGKWVKAIYETFLKKQTGALGALNLWTQNKQPTATSQIAGLLSNPSCTGGKGAAS